jgi:hypothetical protein
MSPALIVMNPPLIMTPEEVDWVHNSLGRAIEWRLLFYVPPALRNLPADTRTRHDLPA